MTKPKSEVDEKISKLYLELSAQYGALKSEEKELQAKIEQAESRMRVLNELVPFIHGLSKPEESKSSTNSESIPRSNSKPPIKLKPEDSNPHIVDI